MNNQTGNIPGHISGKTTNNPRDSRLPSRVSTEKKTESNKGRLQLDKVPTAPKPDLKIMVAKDAKPQVQKAGSVGHNSTNRVKVDLGEKLKLKHKVT